MVKLFKFFICRKFFKKIEYLIIDFFLLLFNQMKYLIIFFSIFTMFNCKIEEDESYIVYVNSENENFNVGSQNPIFAIDIRSKDEDGIFDDPDIEEKSHFNLTIEGEKNNSYEANCRFWKGTKSILIFFDLSGEFKITEKFNITNTTKNITLNSKNVQIKFNIKSLTLKRVEGKLPFLYSKSQQINVTEKDTKIKMMFKIEAYNDEQLFLDIDKYGRIAFETCIAESNNLKCEISKKNFDFLAIKSNSVSVHYIHNSLGYLEFKYLGSLRINYPKINKEDIYFKIVNITNKEVGFATFITFETNITDIDKIYISGEQYQINEESFYCFFIKHDNISPLYFSCGINFMGEYNIEKIEGFYKNNSHYKYNLIFETQTMDVTIHVNSYPSVTFMNIFPETINFASKDVSQILLFIAGRASINSIRFNIDGEDLECTNIPWEIGTIKNCTITREHFNNKESGYYLIHYKNSLNKYVILYESFGLNAILPPPIPPSENPGSSGKMLEYSVGLLALLYLLV